MEQVRRPDALHGRARAEEHPSAQPHHRHLLRHGRSSVGGGAVEQGTFTGLEGFGGHRVPDHETAPRLRAGPCPQLWRRADALRGGGGPPSSRPSHLHPVRDHHRVRERPHRDAAGPGGPTKRVPRHLAQDGAVWTVRRVSARSGLHGGRPARLTLALLVLCWAGCASTPPGPRADSYFAVLARLPEVDGHYVDVSSWQGRGLVVQFLASWCFPCIATAPRLQDLAQRYG